MNDLVIITGYEDSLQRFPDNVPHRFSTFLSHTWSNDGNYICALTRVCVSRNNLAGGLSFIESNLVNESYVRGSFAPLLEMINLKSDESLLDVRFINPLYRPVRLFEPSVLSFELKGDFDPSHIENVVLTLHLLKL